MTWRKNAQADRSSAAQKRYSKTSATMRAQDADWICTHHAAHRKSRTFQFSVPPCATTTTSPSVNAFGRRMLSCGAARLLLRVTAASSAARRGASSARGLTASAAAAQRSAARRGGLARRMAAPVSAAAVDADDDGPPLFSFAILTDVQYADIPDGASYGGTPRYYRHALEALRCAPARPRCLRLRLATPRKHHGGQHPAGAAHTTRSFAPTRHG